MSSTGPGRPQSLVGIRDGVLYVQVDLLSPNGELVAHGFVAKASHMIDDHFKEQAMMAAIKEEQKAATEKTKIDLALAGGDKK